MTADVPDFQAARDHVRQSVVWLARTLRDDGVAVPANAALPTVEALATVGLDDRASVRAATHATLVSDVGDSDTFDEHFPEFWYRLRSGLEATAAYDDTGDRSEAADDGDVSTSVEGEIPETDLDNSLEGSGELSDEGAVQSRRVADSEAATLADDRKGERAGTYSAVGTRSPADEGRAGATVDPAMVRRFEAALATLDGRRWTRSGAGDAVDVRRALRESMETGGVTVSLPTRDRAADAFAVCVLVDVSQSVLDAVDRGFLLSVLDALVAEGRSTRVFFFDTDIREVTDTFAGNRGDPTAALAESEIAWGGGTRIGSSLAALRGQWPSAVDRRTVTLVISDGLEVGDIDELEDGVAWLARRSRALLWLNPLAASAAWEPTCRGMAAAQPYLDGLFAFSGPADLDDAARQLAQRGPHGPVGYEFDFRDRTGGVSP